MHPTDPLRRGTPEKLVCARKDKPKHEARAETRAHFKGRAKRPKSKTKRKISGNGQRTKIPAFMIMRAKTKERSCASKKHPIHRAWRQWGDLPALRLRTRTSQIHAASERSRRMKTDRPLPRSGIDLKTVFNNHPGRTCVVWTEFPLSTNLKGALKDDQNRGVVNGRVIHSVPNAHVREVRLFQ